MVPVLIYAGAALLTGATVASVVTAIAVSLAASALARMLTPDAAGATQFDSSLNITTTAPDDARAVILGRTRVGGTLVFMELTDSSKYLHLVIVYAAHEIDAFEAIYFDDQVVEFDETGDAIGDYSGHARIRYHLGAWDQTADADLVAECPSWTADHRLQGLAYVYLRLKWDADLFTGRPNVAALIRGRKNYDPRDEAQDPDEPDSWVWNDNAAIGILDAYRGFPVRDGTGAVRRLYCVNAPDEHIELAEISAEANICDEDVALAEGGTQKRYTANGVISTETRPEEAVASLLTACMGQRIDAGGQLSLRVAAARTADVALDEGDLTGAISVQPRRSLADLYNGVKGTYRGPDTAYDLADVPPFQDTSLVAEDGRENWLEVTMPYTDTAAEAQRLQRIALAENRRQATAEFPMTLKALKLRAGDWFSFTSARRGWTSKVFRAEKIALAHQDIDGAPFLGVSVTAREIDAGCYTWSSGDQHIVAPPPVSDLPNPLIVPAPSALSAEVAEFGAKARVVLTAVPATDGPTVSYQFAWRLSGETGWTLLPGVADPQTEVLLDVGIYDFRVRAVATPYGGSSPWLPIAYTVGAPALTPRVTGLELVNGGGSEIFTGPDAQFVWRQGSINASSMTGGLDASAGADAGQQDPYFDGYQVTVKATTGAVLRALTLLDPHFTYTLDMNRRDALRVLGEGPQRAFSVTVQQRGKQAQEAALSEPQTLSVRNPAPGAVTGLSTEAFSRAAWLNLTPSADDGDLAGAILKGSATTGFDPASEGTTLYQGDVRSRIQFALTPGEPVYLRVALYDAFGTDSLNWSSEIVTVSQGIGSSEMASEVQNQLATVAAQEGNYLIRLDTEGRITGMALIASDGVEPTAMAAFLVDTFLIAQPGVNGDAPFPVFVIEDGVMKVNAAFIETLSVETLKAVWAVIDELVAGRIRDVDSKMIVDFNDGYIEMDY